MIPGKILVFLEDKGTSPSAERETQPHTAYSLCFGMGGRIGQTNHPVFHQSSLHGSSDQFARRQRPIRSHRRTDRFTRDVSVQRELCWLHTNPMAADFAAHERMTNRFAKAVNQLFGLPEDSCRAYIARPSLVVRFTVREIFLQTPGPGAGHRVFPPEEMTDESKLPDEIKPAMENGIPAIVVTCSADGIPNATIISHVHYVDQTHVALSFQFFNKTIRNVRENSHACVALNDIMANAKWIMDVQYEHSETEGPIFDEMDMRIEAIASASGMAGIFKLRAADIYVVKSVRKLSS